MVVILSLSGLAGGTNKPVDQKSPNVCRIFDWGVASSSVLSRIDSLHVGIVFYNKSGM